MMGQLQNREIDFAYMSFTPSQVKELLKSPHLAMKEHPTTAAPYYTFRIDQLPWRDIEFRKAFHWSIDRAYQVQVMWEGAGRIVTEDTVFVPGHPFHTPVETKHGFDLQRARQVVGDQPALPFRGREHHRSAAAFLGAQEVRPAGEIPCDRFQRRARGKPQAGTALLPLDVELEGCPQQPVDVRHALDQIEQVIA